LAGVGSPKIELKPLPLLLADIAKQCPPIPLSSAETADAAPVRMARLRKPDGPKFAMSIVPPKPDFDYKMLIAKPDPSIDFKLKIKPQGNRGP
jgi:hypothetical protein